VSLQPTIRTLSDFYFNAIIKALKEVNSNKDKLTKFDDNDSFIPRSCRTSFTVGASNLVKGSNEYATLLTNIENNNKISSETNRDFVKQLLQLELNESTKKLCNLFCECLFKLSTMFLHNGHFGSEITNDSIHALSISIILHQPSIIKYIFNASVNDFKTWYYKKYNITVPAPRQRQLITTLLPGGSRNIDDYHPSYGERASYEYCESQQPGSGLDMLLAHRRLNADNNPDEEEDEVATNNPNILLLSARDKEMYVQLMFRMANLHWSHLLQMHHSKYVNAQLAKLADTLLKADITNETAAIVAAQPPASESIISELIEQKFKEFENKHKSSTSTKNNNRGEKKTRASLKNKSKTTPKTNKSKPPNPTPTPRPPRKSPKTKKADPSPRRPNPNPPTNRKRKADVPERGTTNDNASTTTKTKTRPPPKKNATKKIPTKSTQRNGTNKSRKRNDK
jgi:hypothetical protein